MSAPIGPGDWVECVDATPRPGRLGPRLTTGAVYQVETIAPIPDGSRNSGELVLWLVGRPHRDRWNGFYAYRFRPMFRPTQELIDSLKAPPKEAPIQQPETVGGSAGFGPRVAARLVPGET